MRVRRFAGKFATAVLVFAVSNCAGTDDLLGPTAPQGLEGIVLLGPQCPVATPEDPCPDEPYSASIDVRNADGDRVTRVRSGTDGRFRVGLRPGDYLLVPETGDPFPTAGEQEVTVEDGLYTAVTVSFDTGIRSSA